MIMILFVIRLSSFAQGIDTLTISGNYQNANIEDILLDIEHIYHIPFYYKKKWLPQITISRSFTRSEFPIVLKQLLEGSNLSFAIYNNQSIIIAPESLITREFSQEYFIKKDLQQDFINQDNWPANIEIINLGKADQTSSDGEFVINGVVNDALEKDLVVGATIFVKDLDLAVSSDSNGKFILKLPGGLHLVEINMLGFEPKRIGVNLMGACSWNVDLLPEATELDEVLVSGTADDSNIKSNIIGMTKLSPVNIKEMPVFLGEPDLIKSILTLPGVSSIGEGAGGFNVRGGNIDQNLIMQDDALIFNSSHAMGFFSVFNPDVIKDVTLYKGHLPAQYGGRVSSVLDVQLKGNNYHDTNVNGGIGLLASRIAVETPIVKDKTSLLLGGRVAYSDWMLNFASNPNVKNSALGFYDLNGKISQRFGENSTIALSFYNSHDKFTYSDEFGFSWDMNNLSLRWDQVIKPEIISGLSLTYSDISNTSFQPSGIDGFVLGNGMNNYKIKEDLLITQWSHHTINAGFELNAYLPDDETLKPYNEKSTTIPYTGIKDRGLESALYINDGIELSSRLSMSLGLRYAYYSQYGPSNVNIYENNIPISPDNIIATVPYSDGEKVVSYQGWDPRASLAYTINASSSIKVSYNRIHQYIHLISNSTAALPIDYWQVSNTFFEPLRSDNYSLGYFKNYQLNKWETSVEAYYRDMENVVEYKDFPELFLNDHLETELLAGMGKAYGVEVFIKKKTGKFNGWLSYAYARSFVQLNDESRNEVINQGEWFPSKFDQPHNLSIVGNYNFDKSNQFSLNFTYATGRPLTGPDANYGLDGVIIPNFSDRNKFRLPDYYRLDVSYTIKRGLLRTVKYKDNFTFSVYNLLARRNAYSIYFKRDKSNNFGAYKLSILGTFLPSVTYNFMF